MNNLMKHVSSTILLTLSLMACGGSSSYGQVAYEGTVLVVRGERYERPLGIHICGGATDKPSICTPASKLPRYEGGTIMLHVYTSNEKVLSDRLSEYGLVVTDRSTIKAIAEYPAFTALILNVPTLFEEQWVEVFRRDALVISASPNHFFYLP